jgi:large subunit ribosomal protein L5
MNRMLDKYTKTAVPALRKEFGYANVNQIPKITKVVINAGVGRATVDSKHLDKIVEVLGIITGQAPIKTVARNSIAGFKLREGQTIGAMVTLRGERMYEFLDRLVSVVLPRIRDFHGISDTAFDRAGNYSLGLTDHTIFPEISLEDLSSNLSLQVNIVTSAESTEEARTMLRELGFPFRRNV